jgi:hypothetical protein
MLCAAQYVLKTMRDSCSEAIVGTMCASTPRRSEPVPADQRYWAHTSHVWQMLQHDAHSIIDKRCVDTLGMGSELHLLDFRT